MLKSRNVIPFSHLFVLKSQNKTLQNTPSPKARGVRPKSPSPFNTCHGCQEVRMSVTLESIYKGTFFLTGNVCNCSQPGSLTRYTQRPVFPKLVIHSSFIDLCWPWFLCCKYNFFYVLRKNTFLKIVFFSAQNDCS